MGAPCTAHLYSWFSLKNNLGGAQSASSPVVLWLYVSAVENSSSLIYAFPFLFLFLSLPSFFPAEIPISTPAADCHKQRAAQCMDSEDSAMRNQMPRQPVWSCGLSKGPTEAGSAVAATAPVFTNSAIASSAWVAMCSTAASIFATGHAYCHLCSPCHRLPAKTAWILTCC